MTKIFFTRVRFTSLGIRRSHKGPKENRARILIRAILQWWNTISLHTNLDRFIHSFHANRLEVLYYIILWLFGLFINNQFRWFLENKNNQWLSLFSQIKFKSHLQLRIGAKIYAFVVISQQWQLPLSVCALCRVHLVIFYNDVGNHFLHNAFSRMTRALFIFGWYSIKFEFGNLSSLQRCFGVTIIFIQPGFNICIRLLFCLPFGTVR